MHRNWGRALKKASKSHFSVSFFYLFQSPQGDSLAQLVEHNTFNVGVLGSSPRRITIRFIKSKKTSENQRFSEVLLFASYPKSAQYMAISGVQKGSKKFYTEFAPFLGVNWLHFNILRRLRLLCPCFLRELQREQYADNTALLSKYAKLWIRLVNHLSALSFLRIFHLNNCLVDDKN